MCKSLCHESLGNCYIERPELNRDIWKLIFFSTGPLKALKSPFLPCSMNEISACHFYQQSILGLILGCLVQFHSHDLKLHRKSFWSPGVWEHRDEQPKAVTMRLVSLLSPYFAPLLLPTPHSAASPLLELYQSTGRGRTHGAAVFSHLYWLILKCDSFSRDFRSFSKPRKQWYLSSSILSPRSFWILSKPAASLC